MPKLINKTDYIIQRVKGKYKEICGKELDSDEATHFKNNFKDFSKPIKYIIMEDYNFPDFHWRLYDDRIRHYARNYHTSVYHQVVEDYFSDCDTSIIEICDTGLIYDVDKDKFIRLSIEVKEHIEEE